MDLQTFAGDSPLVGIYFSAHWCGPCRNFMPKLVTFLTMLEEEGLRLPVVFGSSDKDEVAFQSYFASMTGDQWHAFPLGDARHPSGSSHREASAEAPAPRQRQRQIESATASHGQPGPNLSRVSSLWPHPPRSAHTGAHRDAQEAVWGERHPVAGDPGQGGQPRPE